MPILTVKVSGEKSSHRTAEIASFLMEITARILKKKSDVTAIVIEHVERDAWFVGGKRLSESGLNSFSLDIKITDETNTKAEKADYIAAAFAGFERILGNLHEESYVYVQDVRATAYGYGGKTQEYRYHR